MAAKKITFRGWRELGSALTVCQERDPYGTLILSESAPGIWHISIECDLLPVSNTTPPRDEDILFLHCTRRSIRQKDHQ